MRTSISFIDQASSQRFLGSRFKAQPLREHIEKLLGENTASQVVLDFTRLEASQSFIDELVGVLVLKNGRDVLDRLVFKGCSAGVRATIEFVVSDRLDEFFRTRAH